MYRHLLLSLLLIGAGNQCYGQVFHDDAFRELAEETLDLIYSMKHEEAERHIESYRGQYETHPAPYFFFALNRWWQTYISETMDAFYPYIEENLSKATTFNANYKGKEGFDLEYTFFQFMNYAFSSRLHILKEEWFKAAQKGRKALPHLKDGFTYTSQSPEFYFGSGLYHYYAEVYPKEHIYIRPFMIFFPDGDAELGLSELQKASTLDNFTQVEASYYLGEIYLDEEKDYARGLEIMRELHQSYPSNSWFLIDYARALTLVGKYEPAKEIFENAISRFESLDGHTTRMIDSRESRFTTQLMMRTYHYFGRILYQENSLEAAKDAFDKSLFLGKLCRLESDEHYPSSQYYIGLCYDAMGKRTEAVKSYRKSLTMDLNGWIKREAKNCMNSPCMP